MKDLLQQDIKLGDYVMGMQSGNNVPEIYIVEKFNPKTLGLVEINGDGSRARRPEEVIVIPDEEIEHRLSQPIVDAVGKLLSVGDTVVSSGGEYIDLIGYTVTAVLKTKVEVTPITYLYRGIQIRHGHDFIKVPAELFTFAMLKEK